MNAQLVLSKAAQASAIVFQSGVAARLERRTDRRRFPGGPGAANGKDSAVRRARGCNGLDHSPVAALDIGWATASMKV